MGGGRGRLRQMKGIERKIETDKENGREIETQTEEMWLSFQ